MKTVTFIKDSLHPGGTPSRYLIWVSFVFIAQGLASIVPSKEFYLPLNFSHFLLAGVLITGIGVNILKGEKTKILAAYMIYIAGLCLSTITISSGITSLSGIIFMLTWAMTLFIAERREYISFDLVVLFMVLMLISTVILLLFEPSLNVSENIIILGTGATLTGVDIFIVYRDFGYEKNYYQESRKNYSNLEILSSKLSEILSRNEPLEKLLWHVTQECVPFLDLEECVIYLYNKEKNKLLQIAAYGNKTNDSLEILNPIELTPGKGIVGKCFSTGQTIIVEETSRHPDYIVDDEKRNSELAVPIFSKGEPIGVIDSEHPTKGFFKERHSRVFHIIASFCGIKITEHYAKESIKQAEVAREETLRLKELDELKNKFITNISHDLKTPLSLIKAPAMQISRITSDEKVRNQADYILKNTEHLLRVVNQLLQLNRVDKGLNELYTEEVRIDKLFEKITTQYRGLAEKNAINFETQIVPLRIFTDSFRLEQITHNLLHNAFRYTGKNGNIELKIGKDNDFLVLTVTDNGPGISEELQEKIFDRFYKVNVNNHEGTGIGLSLVKEYVTSLKGTVEVFSREGKGTAFTVRIPLFADENENETSVAAEPEIIEPGKPCMLVVEDHADLNEFICSFFEQRFRCVSAFDGEKALELISRHTPDIIISDLMMPNMDGTEFLKKLKEEDQFAFIPVIILSAKGNIKSKVELYETGADNYLVKPFDIEELEAIVDSTLEQRRRLRELFRINHLDFSSNNNHPGPSSTNQTVAKTIEYVLGNLDDGELTVRRIEEQLGIGRNKLQKEIKTETGLTPVEFVRSIRLNEARKLLSEEGRQISEVAYCVGFNNLSYFSRAFRNEFGVLPTEWQQGKKLTSEG